MLARSTHHRRGNGLIDEANVLSIALSAARIAVIATTSDLAPLP
jgi:hypothetical protein